MSETKDLTPKPGLTHDMEVHVHMQGMNKSKRMDRKLQHNSIIYISPNLCEVH